MAKITLVFILFFFFLLITPSFAQSDKEEILNTVQKLFDGFIITNGPFGPGELHKPQKVVAGTDRVAVDAYCSTLWELNPKDIHMINMAYDQGIGEKDIKKVKIVEKNI